MWTTWLARLLAGEASCEWASWFRSHHQDWAKPPSNFNQAQWMLDHTALVNQARESRGKLGYTVFTEGQNSFRLRGRGATLAGKPDLIAVKGQDVVIIDAKTGKPSPATRPRSSSISTPFPERWTGTEGWSSEATSSTRMRTCRSRHRGLTGSSWSGWAP